MFRNLFGYAKKAFLKDWSAPDTIKAHFAEQATELVGMTESSGPSLGRLALLGDIIWVQGVNSELPCPELLGYLNSHDILLGNLETSLSGRHSVPQTFPLRTRFNSGPDILEVFRRSNGRNSFSALSLANNHVLDFGDEGLLETMASLESLGIPWSGAQASSESSSPYLTLHRSGLRIGFYAATYGVNRQAYLRSRLRINVEPELVNGSGSFRADSGALKALAAMERDGIDFKVVSLHWGYEYEFYPDSRQLQMAQRLASAGADIIMGHHPHVVQPAEVIWSSERSGPRKTLVLYSLGNFLSNMFTFTLQSGMVASVSLVRDENTGRVGWELPQFRFTHSRRRGREVAGHRLMFMEKHLADLRGVRDTEAFARLRRHVMGAAP
ncbi:MAG: CapA family protein [Bdellovibrionales bacterium]|nr:CapA family protein [Bdellovibrionales bacterium]